MGRRCRSGRLREGALTLQGRRTHVCRARPAGVAWTSPVNLRGLPAVGPWRPSTRAALAVTTPRPQRHRRRTRPRRRQWRHGRTRQWSSCGMRPLRLVCHARPGIRPTPSPWPQSRPTALTLRPFPSTPPRHGWLGQSPMSCRPGSVTALSLSGRTGSSNPSRRDSWPRRSEARSTAREESVFRHITGPPGRRGAVASWHVSVIGHGAGEGHILLLTNLLIVG